MSAIITNPYATPTNPYRGTVRSLIFHKLIEESLDIEIESFGDFERIEAFERLINAANAMQGKVGDFTGINICIHVASSFVLLGSEDKVYHAIEDQIAQKFIGVDPTVILTSAALYYVLKKMLGRLNDDKDRKEVEAKYIEYLKSKTNQENTELTQEEQKKIDEEAKAKADIHIREASQKLENIIKRFDLMNWMIGIDNMKKLGFPDGVYQAREKRWAPVVN